MLVYLLIFLIVEILAVVSCKNKESSSKIKAAIFPIVIVIILSVFGGFRDLTIGTDVLVYGANWFEVATNFSSFSSYVDYIQSSDIGYLFINYIVSRFTDDVHIFLMILQLICNGLVVATLYRYRDKIPFWFSLLVYLCIFYCRTFNILRQAVALSIVFYSIKFLDEKHPIKFVIAVLIASLFHFTAIISLIILLFRKICELNSRLQTLFVFIIVTITFVIVFFIKDIISILYSLGIVNFRIYNYLYDFATGSIDITVIETFFKLLMLLLVLIQNKKIKDDLKLNNLLVLCAIVDFVIYQIRSVIVYSDRLSFYFGYFMMLIFPQAAVSLKVKDKDKLILNTVFIVFLLGFWYYKFVYSGSCEVYPYSSQILGI